MCGRLRSAKLSSKGMLTGGDLKGTMQLLNDVQIVSSLKAYELAMRSDNKSIQVWVDARAVWRHMEEHEPFNPRSIYRVRPTPKLRPWKAEEVPLDAWFCRKDNPDAWFRISSRWAAKNSTHVYLRFEDSMNVPLGIVMDQYLHSTDKGATWSPCGIMEDSE